MTRGNGSSEVSSEAIPLTENAKFNLSAAEAYEYLNKAANVNEELTCLGTNPPVSLAWPDRYFSFCGGAAIFLFVGLAPTKRKIAVSGPTKQI